MAVKIDSVTARDRLKPRREPYWQRISKGNYLGFRKMTAGSGGAWVARSFDEATRRQVYHALGDLTTLPDHQRYDAAVKAAREWFDHLGRGGSSAAMTVAAVCKAYVTHVRDTKGDKAADDAQGRINRHVLSDRKFSRIELTKLTPAHVDTWRRALLGKKSPGGNTRSASAFNRDMTPLRAALNFGYEAGFVTTDFAWKSKLAPIAKADKARDVYLDREQRRRLIDEADACMAVFLTALSLVPMRPGAMAALTAGQFDKRLSVLEVGEDKAGGGRKLHLPPATAKVFTDACKNKLPGAFIFTNSQGRPWNKDTWGYQFAQAAQRAAVPTRATLYCIRHSVITDLIVGGADLLTVARLAGTSVQMIQDHYGHLVQGRARDALAALSI